MTHSYYKSSGIKGPWPFAGVGGAHILSRGVFGFLRQRGICAFLAVPLLALGFASNVSAQQHSAGDLAYDIAILQGLDKVTARVVTIEAPVGVPVHVGALEVVARACKKRRPEDQPESAAFLDVWELRPDQPATGLFRGWMFASSPALSAMEHPVYDLWVLDCRNAKGR